MTKFSLFWLIFGNWALVGTFRFISVPFNGSFWSISFIYIHFSAFCVTVFTVPQIDFGPFGSFR